jgi:hypothetical protein
VTQGTDHQCEFIRPGGTRCRAPARTASSHCWFHDPSLARERLRARKRGGIARSHRAATLPADTPDHPLTSVPEVLSLLQQTANAVRRGELEPRLANCLAYISTVALNGLSQCAPSSQASVVQFLVVPPSGIAPCPSCENGKNPDGTDCAACRGTGTLDLSDVPKSEASVN